MTPQQFQKSQLAIELRAGTKRLEAALHGLSDEQCETVGTTRSGSVVDLLSEIETKEFEALMEISDRLPSLPTNVLAHTDHRMPAFSGRDEAAADKSVKNFLTEFEVLRSALIRRVEDRGPHAPNFDAKYAYVDELCVARFNEQIDEIERWRSSVIVGFSAARLRAEAREAELNQAIVDLSREDFVTGVFDLKSLFSVLFDRFYSEDIVQWLGAVESNGRAVVFQRVAAALEPMHTLLEMGLASIASFRVTASAQDAEGNFTTDWESVFGGAYSTVTAVRWRTVRAWKSRRVIAERIEDLPSPKR
jgi:hypothetical protein